MERYTEDMKLWLFDLAHGNLNDEQVLTGFIRHYVLYDLSVMRVQDDIWFHTSYSMEQAQAAVDTLRRVLSMVADRDTHLSLSLT
ncbi:hypothetical protein [Ruminococcus gauvreauii]|uniref:hypothetical protein n=1 Tax=Ruminococcus gauvreauii TaxID=438033 RepID=UPI003983EFBB